MMYEFDTRRCFHIHLMKFLHARLKSQFNRQTVYASKITTSSEAEPGPMCNLHKCEGKTGNIQYTYTEDRLFTEEGDTFYPVSVCSTTILQV